MSRLVPILTGTLAIGTVAAAILLLRPPPTEADAFREALSSVGFTMDLPDDLHIVRTKQHEGRLQTALVESGSTRIRLQVSEGLNTEAAIQLSDDIRLQIDNLFEDRQAPYPGQLSNTLQCPPRFHPVEVLDKGAALFAVQLYANDRMGFGGCSEDLLHYAATVGLVHDPVSERLVRLEVFEPIDATTDQGLPWLRSLRP